MSKWKEKEMPRLFSSLMMIMMADASHKKKENCIFTIFVMTSRLKPASDLLVCLLLLETETYLLHHFICCPEEEEEKTWESSSLHEIRWWWKDEDNRKLWSHSRAFSSFLLLHHWKLAWGWSRDDTSSLQIIILLSSLLSLFFLYKKMRTNLVIFSSSFSKTSVPVSSTSTTNLFLDQEYHVIYYLAKCVTHITNELQARLCCRRVSSTIYRKHQKEWQLTHEIKETHC